MVRGEVAGLRSAESGGVTHSGPADSIRYLDRAGRVTLL